MQRMMNPQTVDELKDLLIKNNVDISLYGQGLAKTLQQLFQELKSGECFLTEHIDGKILRTVYVTTVFILHDKKVLIESKQTFHKTQQRAEWSRSRYYGVAEKGLPDEKIVETIIRALKEELGLDFQENMLIKLEESIETKSSQSYPGLNTRYYTSYAFIDGESLKIPDDYKYTEYFADGTPRLTSTWTWMNSEEIKNYNYQVYNKVKDYL